MISCPLMRTRTSMPSSSSDIDRDAAFMRRALQLAARGLGRTTPNPIVGAVVVDSAGTVVGQGAHLGAGLAHAEIIALDAAGAKAAGATLYCTLEPCSHTGRTGPCVERIVAARVARVVAAARDPNPRVNGRGFEFLRHHGIDVIEGVCRDEATAQNRPFITWVTRHRPFITLKIAVSRDGFVGAANRRVMLTSPDADRFFQRQRAIVDAIAVGSRTVAVDDPRLTARSALRYRPLTRAIFDWHLTVPSSARVFSTVDAGPVIMVVLASVWDAHRLRHPDLTLRGVVVMPFETRELAPVMRALADREIQSLLVEGGPTLHDAFARAGLVDRVQRISTPHVLGDGVPEAGVTRSILSTAMPVTRAWLGPDEFLEADVHRID